MRASLALALVFLAATAAEAQSGPFRPMAVRSCPAADSRLGALGADAPVTVYGFYDKTRDTSYFVTSIGDPKGGLTLRFSTKRAGSGPLRDPGIVIHAFPTGRDKQVLAELSKLYGPVRTVFIVDDAVTVYQRPAGSERFESGAPTMTPSASGVFGLDDWLKIVAAPKGVVRFGPVGYMLESGERRDIRAMVRVALCPQ